jgi:hypothetical protein
MQKILAFLNKYAFHLNLTIILFWLYIIYENYKPKNVYDMREYILYTIDKSLTKALKRG